MTRISTRAVVPGILAFSLSALVYWCVGLIRQIDLDNSLVASIFSNNACRVQQLLALGANPNTRVSAPSLGEGLVEYLRELPLASRQISSRSALQVASFPVAQRFMSDEWDRGNALEAANAGEKAQIDASISMLLEHGADANPPGSQLDCPLLWACARNDLALVKLLLLHHANPNGQAKQSRERVRVIWSGPGAGQAWPATPLFLALRNQNLVMARCLLDAGADPNIECEGGVSLLTCMVPYFKPSIIQFALDHGANVNYQNWDGRTALHIAVHRPEIVRILLGKDARTDIRDHKNLSASDEATRQYKVTSYNPDLASANEILRFDKIQSTHALTHTGKAVLIQ